MKDVFFVRFNLQRSCAALGQDQFDCAERIGLSRAEISDFIQF